MASTTATPSYTTGSNGVSWGSAVDYAQHNSAYYGALASYETAPSAAAMGQINWQSSYPAQMAPAMNQLFPSFARNSTQKVNLKIFSTLDSFSFL